jgi:gamma-glutamyltranspeptidase/glutathione hydrolase
MEDLADYTPIVRKPLRTSYRGYEIISIPPPSSGGMCLIELLNTIEGYDLTSMGYHSSHTVHVMTEAMKRVYADRAEFLGDPNFVSIPTEHLISKQYAASRRAEIDTLKATAGNLIRQGNNPSQEGKNTTHFVVIDSSGNIVSTTYTINDLFGSKVIVTGAGFFLNDEMDDFSIKSGVPNAYGLIGGNANAIEPGKRPLSSMTPTIVLKDGNPIMVLGARGGSRIITGVFQTIINVIDFGMNMCEAVDAPRFHHQWIPDELIYEKYCLPKDVVENLEGKGHTLKETNSKVGALETIYIDQANGWIYGVPDDREGGVADGF